MIRVVAVDDHTSILAGLKTFIAEHRDMQLVGTADHGSKLLDLIREHHPDVAILDLGVKTGEFDPVASVRAAKKEFPDVKVLILTGYKSGIWARALVKAGASGYLLKEDALSRTIGDAIRELYAGGRYFSPQISGELIDYGKDHVRLARREQQLITLLYKGNSTDVVAESLGVSEKRIRNMLMTICNKLGIEEGAGLSPRIAAINKVRELGLLPDIDMDANLVELLSRTEDDDRP